MSVLLALGSELQQIRAAAATVKHSEQAGGVQSQQPAQTTQRASRSRNRLLLSCCPCLLLVVLPRCTRCSNDMWARYKEARIVGQVPRHALRGPGPPCCALHRQRQRAVLHLPCRTHGARAECAILERGFSMQVDECIVGQHNAVPTLQRLRAGKAPRLRCRSSAASDILASLPIAHFPTPVCLPRSAQPLRLARRCSKRAPLCSRGGSPRLQRGGCAA